MAAHKEDLRIIKTRAALQEAFFDLLATMELSDITVNKLCEHSGVRRATFYKHFKDKDDFIIHIFKSVRHHFDTSVWNKEQHQAYTKEYYHKYAESLFNFIMRHEDAMRRVSTSPLNSTFVHVFLQQNYEDTKRRLEASVKAGMPLIASPDVVASMLIGGTAHCIVSWFSAENKCTPEALLKDVTNFIDRVLA